MELELERVLLRPSSGGKALLLLQGDKLQVLSADGARVTDTKQLPKRYEHFDTRGTALLGIIEGTHTLEIADANQCRRSPGFAEPAGSSSGPQTFRYGHVGPQRRCQSSGGDWASSEGIPGDSFSGSARAARFRHFHEQQTGQLAPARVHHPPVRWPSGGCGAGQFPVRRSGERGSRCKTAMQRSRP